MSEPILEKIRQSIPSALVTTEMSDLKEFGKDWTKFTPPDPLAVVFPRTTEEVSKLLKLCHENGYPVVPSGGRTGLAGGAVAAKKEIVLSLSKMTRMDPVDPIARTVRVQAGAVTEAVHEHCEKSGLTWPIDFASKGSSCVGGNIATNAGGVNVIRYGLTRQWVLGLQVVLANGEVLELNGALEKNNTGLDLRQLFIGSEGTLGVITEATLKLSPPPGESDVFLFAVDGIGSVLNLFKLCRTSGFTLNAFEFFTDLCLKRVTKHLHLTTPFATSSSHYVLVDLERPAESAELESWLETVLSSQGVLDGTMAQNSETARNLWMLREGISESLSSTGLPHKNDVSIPIAKLREFCDQLDAFFSSHYPDFEVCVFGHIGDGNLHINVMKPDALPLEEFKKKTKAVDHDLFKILQTCDGSISAEHGIGLLKKEFLPYSRTPEEIALFKAMKKVFDPKNILNPGKIFD